jgi:hypothetical protein
MISGLIEDGTIDWYCFLIHDRTSGVPTASDDNALYLHLRFALSQSASESKFQNSLPDCCSMTRNVGAEQVSSIAGLDKALLKNDDIAEAWRIIGEQSEWLLDMLMVHKEDARLFPNQVNQFLHYYSNMTGLQVL